jgi:hypothetical protein
VTGGRNQGSCGSCWAFSTTAALESKALITFDAPNQDLNLSEQILLSCTDSLAPGGDSKPNNCEKGGYASTAADVLVNYGTAEERCYPYTGANGSCGNACTGWQNDTYKIDGWSYVVNGTATSDSAIKTALQSGPVVAWMKVYQDFYSYVNGVYTRTSTTYVGNHFILIVGYDDALGAFKIKNSWGTGWGQSGFGWISFSELYPGVESTNHTQFGKWVYAFGNAVHNSPTSECDYQIDFYPVSYSGKAIDDGYYSTGIGDSGWELVVCGTYSGDTADSFVADIYDGDGNLYEKVHGHIVWAKNFKSAYIQGDTYWEDDSGNVDTFYMNGTLKASRGVYSFTTTAGETYTNDGSPWIVLFSSFKSTAGYVLDKNVQKDMKRRIRTRDKKIWKRLE